jgi:putative transposase
LVVSQIARQTQDEGVQAGESSWQDAARKINERKCDISTDTLELLIFILIHGADIQDRAAAPDCSR